MTFSSSANGNLGNTNGHAPIAMDEYNIDWLLGQIEFDSAQEAMGFPQVETRAVGDKTALVLAGGGLAGVGYEVGALRAINGMLVDRSVTDFDVFIGTSAGAIVATILAIGVSPCDMFRILDGTHPEIPPADSEKLLRLNWQDYMRRAVQVPRILSRAAWKGLRHPEDISALYAMLAMADALPSGIYETSGLEEFITAALEWGGGYKTFAELPADLHLIATELNSGQRAVFSRHTTPNVSIARAVAASAAIPLFYKPVEIDGKEYVDGGVRASASLDLALEHGASLVLVINPAVPLTVDETGIRVSERGGSAILSQTWRTMAHASLTYQMKQLSRRYPGADFILLEPRGDDEDLFVRNIMRYSTRTRVAERGFESVTLGLAHDYSTYKEILARHGIPITRRRVARDLAAFQAAGGDPNLVAAVLESDSSCGAERQRQVVTSQLEKVLAELDAVLDAELAERQAAAEVDVARAEAAA